MPETVCRARAILFGEINLSPVVPLQIAALPFFPGIETFMITRL
jgi:hypothetical protein